MGARCTEKITFQRETNSSAKKRECLKGNSGMRVLSSGKENVAMGGVNRKKGGVMSTTKK